MSFLELAHKRRSIRKYADRAVEREKLDECLDAARLAPSACNGQPWKFAALTDAAAKDAFCKEAFTGAYAVTAFAAKAPVIVAFIQEKTNITCRIGEIVQDKDYRSIDLGLACENFALAAADLGLGTCIIGWFSEKKAGKALKLPDSKKVVLLVSLGYPAEDPAPRPRKDRSETVSYNAY